FETMPVGTIGVKIKATMDTGYLNTKHIEAANFYSEICRKSGLRICSWIDFFFGSEIVIGRKGEAGRP
ncbi:MAG: hypothetical protein WBI57_09185, partial [Desulfobacterales bacterium]